MKLSTFKVGERISVFTLSPEFLLKIQVSAIVYPFPLKIAPRSLDAVLSAKLQIVTLPVLEMKTAPPSLDAVLPVKLQFVTLTSALK